MTTTPTILAILPITVMIALSGCTNAYRQDQQMKRADRLFELKRYQEASIEYANVLRKTNTNLVALCQLGRCNLELSNLEQAFPLLYRAEKLAPDNAYVKTLLAQLHLANGDPDKARELALTALKKESRPVAMLGIMVETSLTRTQAEETLQLVLSADNRFATNAEYQTTAGLLSLRLGDFKSAETHFKQALSLDPAFSRGYLGLAMLHQTRGDKELAEENFKKASDRAGLQSPETVKWALFKLECGKPEEAKHLFKTMAEQYPRNPFPLLQLARIALSQQKFEEAENMTARILHQFPRYIEASRLQAQSKMAHGKINEALTELQQLTFRYPHAWSLRYDLALAYLKSTTPDKAISELKTALQLKPDFTDATLLLADLSIRSGDASAAIALLNELAAKQPRLSQIYVLLGAAHQTLGQLDRALDAYSSLGKINPGNPQSFYLAGLVYLKQQHREAAIHSFLQAAQLSPGFSLPLAQLVTLDLAEHQSTRALTRIDQAIQQAPQSGELHYLRGQVYLRTKDLEKAESAFQRALELAPDSLPTYVALSQLYLVSHRDAEALQRMEQALQKNPNDPACLMLSALLWTQQNNLRKSTDTYEKLLLIKPDFTPALNNLACLYASSPGEMEKAFKLALHAREVAPHDPCVADTLGWILYRKGDIHWAASLLQESAEALPSESEVGYHLAMAQLKLGQELAATETLRKTLQSEKGFPQKDQASHLLTLLDSPMTTAREALIQRIRCVLKEDPDNPAALTRLAAIYAREGDKASAIKTYQKVRDSNPSFFPATLQLASLLQNDDTTRAKALELAKLARENAPGDPTVAHLLGWLAFQENQFHWSLSLLLEAYKTSPRDPQLLYHLALVKYRLGMEQDAIALMKEALALKIPFGESPEATEFLDLTDPGKDSASPQAALQIAKAVLEKEVTNIPALMLTAKVLLSQGNRLEAQRVYEQILSRHPDFIPALLAMTSLASDTSAGLQHALEAAQKARALMPDSIPIAKLLGQLSLSKENYKEAAVLFQEIVNKTPYDTESLLNLGVSSIKLKDYDAARKALKRAIDSAPTSAAASSARQWLDKLAQ